MKLHSSTKIAIAFVLVVAFGYFGYQIYARQSVANLHFNPVIPGDVNLVGIDAGSGYRIIVADDIAQLVQASDTFGAKESDSGGVEGGAIKFRIPVKEMLGVFRGDSKALGEFVMIMNDMHQDEKWPTVQIVWKAEDIRKAINGDPVLEPRLVRDLNMKLDGSPLPSLRPSTLENGIIVDYPVSLTVNINGVPTQVVGRVQQPYKPRLMASVEEKLSETHLTDQVMAGFYADAAKKILANTGARENIKTSLEAIISKQHEDLLRDAPEHVLQSATVVINEHQISKAKLQTYEINGKEFNDMTIDLTDEGRKRLWKYSVDKVGTDLLLLVDGVAIAAPRIERPLTEQELTIKKMPDRVLAQDAVDRLNKASTVSQSR